MLLKQSTSYFNFQLESPPCPRNYSATISHVSRLQAQILRNRPHVRKEVIIVYKNFYLLPSVRDATRDLRSEELPGLLLGNFSCNSTLRWKKLVYVHILRIKNSEFPMIEKMKNETPAQQIKSIHFIGQVHSMTYVYTLLNCKINSHSFLWINLQVKLYLKQDTVLKTVACVCPKNYEKRKKSISHYGF